MALPFSLVSEETDAQGVKQILQDFVAPRGRVDTPNLDGPSDSSLHFSHIQST